MYKIIDFGKTLLHIRCCQSLHGADSFHSCKKICKI